MVLTIVDPKSRPLFEQLRRGLFNPDVYDSVRRGDLDALVDSVSHAMDSTTYVHPPVIYDMMRSISINLLPAYDLIDQDLAHAGVFIQPHYVMVQDGMGYGHYGHIRVPTSDRHIYTNLSVRIKDYVKFIQKVAANVVDASKGEPVSQQIHDTIAFRIIVGPTDNQLYPRGERPEVFDPSSPVLDEVVQFMTNNSQASYFDADLEMQPSSEHIGLVHAYNARINRLIQSFEGASNSLNAALGASPMHDFSHVYTSLQNHARVLGLKENIAGDYLLDEHIEELALQRLLTQIFVHKFSYYREKFRDYVQHPRDNGYQSVQFVFPQHIGFNKILLEGQVRTGLQHVCASHPELWGHKKYEKLVTPDSEEYEVVKQMLKPMLPDWDFPVRTGVLSYFTGYEPTNAYLRPIEEDRLGDILIVR